MFALLLTLMVSVSHATTMLVVTDQPKAVKAQEVAKLFRTTAPFSLMKDLKIKVIETTPRKLGCATAAASSFDLVTTLDSVDDELLMRSESRDRTNVQEMSAMATLPASCSNKDGPISRLISCDTPQANSYLNALQRTEKASVAIVVKTDSRYGCSGGKRAVITTSSPATMAIHELMHQLGFADEYAYTSACEADIYCPPGTPNDKSPSGYGNLPGTSFNIAAFNSKSSYSSNSDVRASHGKSIPWMSFISSKTELVTGGKIGTPPAAGVTGLYRSIVCDKATRRRDTWQAVADATIMKSLSTTNIPKAYWPTLAKSLGTTIAP